MIQAVVFGIVQGLTEFLPISSSGHLFLVPGLLGWSDPGAGFTAVIQLGTILAVLIYFRADLARVLGGWIKSWSDKSLRQSPEARIGWAVAWGTVPITLAGLALEKMIDSEFRTGYVVAGTLVAFGILLAVAEKAGSQARTLDDVTVADGLKIGLWQCLALVPGSSRSGCTLTGGMFAGLDRPAAARFSFLLSIPAIVLSGAYKLVKDRHELLASGTGPTLVATALSFFVGLWAISFLMKFLQTRSTMPFVAYRVLLGLVVFALVLAGRVPNQPRQVTHGILQEARHA